MLYYCLYIVRTFVPICVLTFVMVDTRSSLCILKEKRKCGNLEYVFPQFYVSSSLWIASLQQLIIVCSHLRFSIQTTVFCSFAPFYHLVLIIPCFLVIFFWLWFSFFRNILHHHRGPVVKTTFFVLNDSQKFPSHNLDTDKWTSSMHHEFTEAPPSFLNNQGLNTEGVLYTDSLF